MGGHPESTSPAEMPSPGKIACSGCSGCPAPDCPVEDATEGSPLAGWRLGLASTGLFLAPVGLAIVGALSLGDRPGGQFAGAIAGLGLGLAGSVGVGSLLRRGK